MRETVCLVLNEREPHKARAAEALIRALGDFDITASRIDVSEDPAPILLEHPPMVVVLDYLLGDVTTGLDVLEKLSVLAPHKRPCVFFLTDEPSVPVAVEAMQRGAKNYFEIDNPQSLTRLSREIYEFVRAARSAAPPPPPQAPALKLDDLVAQSEPARRMLEQARAIVKKHPSCVIVHGTTGSGRRTLARAIFAEVVSETNLLLTVNLNHTFDPIEDVFGISSSGIGPQLGKNLYMLIENAEEDDGNLLRFATECLRHTPSTQAKSSMLILCTSSSETVRAWSKALTHSETLHIPSLAERAKDIPALAQKFVIEASEFADQKVKAFDASALSFLGTLSWPGEIRELRAVVIDAALTSLDSSQGIRAIIEEKRALWDECRQLIQPEIGVSALSAALALERCGHNYRLAAAMLGCHSNQLCEILHSAGQPKER